MIDYQQAAMALPYSLTERWMWSIEMSISSHYYYILPLRPRATVVTSQMPSHQTGPQNMHGFDISKEGNCFAS